MSYLAGQKCGASAAIGIPAQSGLVAPRQCFVYGVRSLRASPNFRVD